MYKVTLQERRTEKESGKNVRETKGYKIIGSPVKEKNMQMKNIVK